MEINTTQISGEPSVPVYRFMVSGERGAYEVSFIAHENMLKAHCTCGLTMSPCWHIEYVIAGKTSRIVKGDPSLQNEVISLAESFPESRGLLRKARKKYAGETHCRRCSSSKIAKLESSLTARLATLFRETKNHNYYCRKCGWTW